MIVHLRGVQLLTTEKEFTLQVEALQAAHRMATASYELPSVTWDVHELWQAVLLETIDLPHPTGDHSFAVQLIDKDGAPQPLWISGDTNERGNYPPFMELYPPTPYWNAVCPRTWGSDA